MDFDHFEGIVEVDETYFLYSQKGQRGITGLVNFNDTFKMVKIHLL